MVMPRESKVSKTREAQRSRKAVCKLKTICVRLTVLDVHIVTVTFLVLVIVGGGTALYRCMHYIAMMIKYT